VWRPRRRQWLLEKRRASSPALVFDPHKDRVRRIGRLSAPAKHAAAAALGGVSANGDVLWLSGRYNSEVYAISTRTGGLLARIPVRAGPHGLCVWPQPGRYSLGHTDNMR
jgi:hypothetical protein